MMTSNSKLLQIHLPVFPISVILLSWMLVRGSAFPSGEESLNEIDVCWKGDPYWQDSRKSMSDCPKGYGAHALGGKEGPIYMVTDITDDPTNPKNGTLRFAVNQNGPLWIIFQQDIQKIQLKSELYMSSYKTLDGRDANITIGGGPCLRIENSSHVIIHNLIFEGCGTADGDAIALAGASHVWIDHCAFANCAGRFITLSYVSTNVTISNNIFQGNSKAMMFGHSDEYNDDKDMRVTVVYNQFRDLAEEIPRVRFGYAHIANNMYSRWMVCAIGGSANPTIRSEHNNYTAGDNADSKEITCRDKNVPQSKWSEWSWTSSGDLMFNGAHFLPSGQPREPSYLESERFTVASASRVPDMVHTAGPKVCVRNWPC